MQDFEFFDILNHLYPKQVKECLDELGVGEEEGCDYIGDIEAHLINDDPYILFDLTEKLLGLTMPITSPLTGEPRQCFGIAKLNGDGKTVSMTAFVSQEAEL